MDPSGGGVSKAAGELLKEMQQAQQELQQMQEQQEPSGANFQSTMEAQQTQSAQQVQDVKPVEATAKSQNVLMQAQINSATPAPSTTAVGGTAAAERSQMVEIIEQLAGGQDKMSNIMNLALSGKKFSSTELLGMQAGIYRFSQELEITSKVVE
ncbi:uncharacterized protein METZ01_LOCUS437139, partial [marine metagenome]